MFDVGTFEAIGGAIVAVSLGAWRVWKTISDKITKKETAIAVPEVSKCQQCSKEKEMDAMAIRMKSLEDLVKGQGAEIAEFRKEMKESNEHMSTVREDVSWMRGALSAFLGLRDGK